MQVLIRDGIDLALAAHAENPGFGAPPQPFEIVALPALTGIDGFALVSSPPPKR